MTSSTAYEQIVKVLLTTRFRGSKIRKFQAFHLKKYIGKSGQKNEIDVSFEFEVAGLDFLVLVECKDYGGRKVGVEDISAFAYRLRDIGGQKGVMVTTNGFQKGATTVAQAEGIGLLVAAQGKLLREQGPPEGAFSLWFKSFYFDISERGKTAELYGERLFGEGHDIAMIKGFFAMKDRFVLEDEYSDSLAFLTPENIEFLDERGRL